MGNPEKRKSGIWILALPIVMAVCINLAIVQAAIMFGDASASEDPIVALIGSAIVVLIVHNNESLSNTARERQGMLIVKLGLLPIIFLNLRLIADGFMRIEFLFQSLILACILWPVVLLGSVWTICYTLSLSREGRIGYATTAVATILSLFLVLDYVAVALVFFKGRAGAGLPDPAQDAPR